MDATGTRRVTPRLRPGDRDMPARPWIDGFSSGYVQRVMHRFPKQGDREPWLNPQNYARDKKMLRAGALEDGVLVFDNPVASPASRERATVAAPDAAPPQRAATPP
jgi:hypothetical protein